ncbi:hypothetical protein [Paraburkholderia domus]|nr:hypothetical protein [Paraburkholderia domus]MBK5053012.1 hypothetical protein [Burkholderia sp. R-70006]MBK5065332.1 hypothetical protein [Burkholderia sp. R-70199]MBK5089762.1 hypothetical protein [Burkholderia sp. R-69927]MBK5124460.1 hypothetical protein [Burkholderia sp. R-69980]MBK5168782.1 hypothetical protein [Burkholderia sp. R-70211]MBK5184092.1 hypothetical protein [Burkholderia sp. R-69749]MCI0147697.1 hypothetical protein [Paraburkholderia sediminicola]
MSYKKKCLGISALIITSLAAFFLGCLFTKKHDAGKTTIGDDKISNLILNDPNAWINPYSASSPIHREFDEFKTWMLNNRKLATLSDSTNPSHLLRLSGQLQAKGVPRLPTDLLEQRLSSVSKILPSLDTHLCSTLLKGGFSTTEFMVQASSAMESFNDEEAKAWFLVNKAAIEAQLDGLPLVVLSTEDATRGIVEIAKSMYGPQSRAFISGLTGLKTANDEDTCTTVRILYTKGNSLPEPYRGYMARWLLTGKEGNEEL